MSIIFILAIFIWAFLPQLNAFMKLDFWNTTYNLKPNTGCYIKPYIDQITGQQTVGFCTSMSTLQNSIKESLIKAIPMSFLLFDKTDYIISLNHSFSLQNGMFNSKISQQEQLVYNVTFKTNNRTKDYDEISCQYFIMNQSQ